MKRAECVVRASLGRGHDPDKVRLVGGDGRDRASFTLIDLDRVVAERAADLTSEGVLPGTVAPVVVEPDIDGVLTLLALWRAGATVVPLNPLLTEGERAAARAALGGMDGEGTQAILWTSGSTGRPRGVALSFDAMQSHADAVAERIGGEGDVWLASLSPAHVGGLMLIVRALLTDGCLVAAGRLAPGDLERRLRVESEHAVTHLSLVPTQLVRLLDGGAESPPPRLRCVLLGGAHTPSELLDRALGAGWPIALTYGMTEMTSQVATAPPVRVREKPGSTGQPLEGVEVRIARDGEILVRSEHAASRYLGDGALTPQDDRALTDQDGWYRTGDLGRVDDDGDLWITGRKSDRIITGGVNVDPKEVEEALRAHPAIVDVCVVGVPDTDWGEAVGVWVVPVEGEFDLDTVQEWLRGELAGPKRPRRWIVEDRLPMNANGKVDRILVREALER